MTDPAELTQEHQDLILRVQEFEAAAAAAAAAAPPNGGTAPHRNPGRPN
jgi:hypothetical protein